MNLPFTTLDEDIAELERLSRRMPYSLRGNEIRRHLIVLYRLRELTLECAVQSTHLIRTSHGMKVVCDAPPMLPPKPHPDLPPIRPFWWT